MALLHLKGQLGLQRLLHGCQLVNLLALLQHRLFGFLVFARHALQQELLSIALDIQVLVLLLQRFDFSVVIIDFSLVLFCVSSQAIVVLFDVGDIPVLLKDLPCE